MVSSLFLSLARKYYNILLVSYATMALREILRVETDKNSMIKLNNYKKESDDTPEATKYDLKRECDKDTEEEQSVAKLLKVQ